MEWGIGVIDVGLAERYDMRVNCVPEVFMYAKGPGSESGEIREALFEVGKGFQGGGVLGSRCMGPL
jgi:hypothetical protein